MTKPFMIRFPFGGKNCYANVYMHEAELREYHIHIIEHKFYDGLPSKIVLVETDNELRPADSTNCPRNVLGIIAGQIKNQPR